METLDRGLVAIKVSGGVYTSWRIPGDEWYDVTYNLYRNGTKVNASPLTVSNYTDASGTASSTYTVRAVVNGVEQADSETASVWSQQYLEIPMADVVSKNGTVINSCYTLNDACAADLDGDGQYELIVKRSNTDFTLANDTAYCLFQAYKLDGTLLWTLNMGPNLINAGHVETNCLAFDFDEDGKAEVVLRGTDGTILPDGTVLGNATANYRPASYTDGNTIYQTQGDEWLVVLNGETGKLIDQVIFDSKTGGAGNNLARRSAAFWWAGNSKAYGHRANKFHFGAPYLDGRHPSIYVGRGCYTNMHAAAYDLVGGKLQLRWANAVDDTSSPFYGQGYHNFSIVDVDLDGRDEICHGNMVIDDDGSWLSSTGLGHGDAQHYGDLDPYRKGMEGFRCLEDNPGAVFVDAATSEILFRWVRGNDCGRCLAGNFTDDFPGQELWTVDGHLWSASTSRAADQVVASSAPGVTMNFRIFWDGDLLDESFDYESCSNNLGVNPSIYKYGSTSPIFKATGCYTNNGSKGNACLQADLFGDWREEFVVRTTNDMALRIYTTIIPTDNRIYSLNYDTQYRQAMYWQECGYNQPPHVSYYLSAKEGITLPPPPSCTNGKTLVGNSMTSATDGKFLLMAETTNTDVAASGTLKPQAIQVNTPADYTLTGGTFAGSMRFLKQGLGTLTLQADALNYTGNTEVWYGTLVNNTDLTASHLILRRFAEADLTGAYKKGITTEHGSVIRPGGTATGTLTASCLELNGGAILELNLSADGGDVVTVDTLRLGAANAVGATPIFRVVASGQLTPGKYALVTATKAIEGAFADCTVEGVELYSTAISAEDNIIYLTVKDQRAATSIYWDGAKSNIWNLNDVQNFLNGSTEDLFVNGDDVIFGASATNQTVEIAENVYPSSVVVEGDKNYTFTGAGRISGTTSLVKNGTGTLTINNQNDFTGGVRINEGRVVVSSLSDAQNVGALGAYSTEVGKIYIGDGATLAVQSAVTNATPISVGNGAILENSAAFTQSGAVSGASLVKKGNGTLTFSAYNSLERLEIEAGTVKIPTEYAGQSALGDTVVLRGGTLQFDDNSSTYGKSYAHWVVPAGATATANLDSRCEYYGSLTGAGTLTIYVPKYYRTYMRGDWSNFTGTLKATGGQSDTYPIVFANTKGLPNATLNIPNAGDVVQLGNSDVSTSGTFKIGKLTGKGKLASGSSTNNVFEVGSLVAAGKSFTFDGSSDAKLTKVGAGTMILTANTGSGAITVKEGTLQANGTNATTTVTGTGAITVEDGATVNGRGYMGNAVTVKSGGTFSPGRSYASSLTVKGTVTINEGGIFDFRINANSASTPYSSVSMEGILILSGIVRVGAVAGREFNAGESFTLWTCKTLNKNHVPTSIELPELPEGLKWDTSELLSTTGTIKVVVDENSALHQVNSDDHADVIIYNVNGTEATRFTTTSNLVYVTAENTDLPNGLYLMRIRTAAGTTVKKWLKK
jgi:autotransporter-associated beta strand protein